MAQKRVRVGKRHHAWVKWVIAAGVVAVLGAVFAASVGVGSWLLQKAEQYPADGMQENETVPPEQIVPVKVSPIKAYAYTVGDRYSSYTYAGIRCLCAPLRTEDGALAFESRVCERAGWEQNGKDDLQVNAYELHKNGLYLCTYLPITGFAEQDAAVRELVLSYEASLIAEAAACGVDEIFVTGIDVTQANIGSVVKYLQRIKGLAGNTAIGVMITPRVLLAAEYDVYLSSQLLSVCDYLVLDLRGLPLTDTPTDTEAVSEADTEAGTEIETTSNGSTQQSLSITYITEHMQYDLTRYSPRLALDQEQTDELDYLIAKGYSNWVIME